MAKIAGHGHRRIAADLAVPAAIVRGWLRRATVHADQIRMQAVEAAHRLDAMFDPPAATGSRLGDALQALGAVVAAAIRRLGPLATPWHLAATITGELLVPPRRARSD